MAPATLLAFAVRLTRRPADPTHKPSCHGETVAAEPTGGGTALRAYEVMVILDPSLEERTVGPSLDKYLNVIRKDCLLYTSDAADE